MTFQIQLVVSFLVGGVFIALQTLFAERYTGFWRGVILTIPSTMALGLFFIGLTKTPADVPEASLIIPASLGIVYVYVMVFSVLSSRGFFISILGSLAVWALGAYLLLSFPPTNLITSTFAYGLPLIIVSYFLVKRLPQVTQLKPFPIGWKNILIRSFIGGAIILLAVVLANTLGNIWGGLFSSFPAVFTSTFVIYYHFQGKHVIPSVAKNVFFPGSIGMIIYVYVTTATFPAWGIWLGTLAAYAATFAYFALHAAFTGSFKSKA